MRRTSNIVWGLVLIVLGIIFGLNALELTNINVFFPGWWTLFIIIPSFIGIITDSEKTWSIICFLIGIFVLLGINDYISFELVGKLVFPVILIILGISFIFKDNLSKKLKKELEQAKKSDKSYVATFSSNDVYIDKDFKGCEVNAVFGEVNLDLRNAKITDNCIIKTSSIFGEVNIKVPEDIKVETLSTSIFGSTDNNKKDGSKHTIYVEAFNLFGGTDIK